MCDNNGFTYVGQLSGAIDRIDQQGQVNKAFMKLPHLIVSLAKQNERIYILMHVDTQSSLICVHELYNNNKEIISWQHPCDPYYGKSMFVNNDNKLAVGDRTSSQIIIYSLMEMSSEKFPVLPLCL